MCESCTLTVAVPTFNMEWCLQKNLETYFDERFKGRLEVLVLNNASEDRSASIAEEFCRRLPEVYKLINRDSRGYGSSINEAIHMARGRYFRIVDADDWVDTEELFQLTAALESCEADVVLTDYQIVHMQTRESIPVRALERGVVYGRLYTDFQICMKTLPSIHATTYRTNLLREEKFNMQDNMFFVDEEYVILPYLRAESVIYFSFDVYRYQVANPGQSTSPQNRAKYYKHREKVLRRLIRACTEEVDSRTDGALDYCRFRVQKGVGDHYTTMYMYFEDRRSGRLEASKWSTFLKSCPSKEFYLRTRWKAWILLCLNCLHVSLQRYEHLKKVLHGKGKEG